jgi:hypothetical protein
MGMPREQFCRWLTFVVPKYAKIRGTDEPLHALRFRAGLGKGPLKDFIAFLLVVCRSDFQESLAHLRHTTPFGCGDCFEGPFEI